MSKYCPILETATVEYWTLDSWLGAQYVSIMSQLSTNDGCLKAGYEIPPGLDLDLGGPSALKVQGPLNTEIKLYDK